MTEEQTNNPQVNPEEPQVNPDEPPNFNIESEADVEPLVLQLKAFLEKHDLDVSVKFKPKKMRGSTSLVDGDGLKTGEVNIPADFKITGKDNNGKDLGHGGDDVKVKVIDPQGNEVPCEVKDNGDGTYDVGYTPVVPGMHKIEVVVNDEPVENTPVDVLVFDEIPDALNCTAEGEGLENAETKTPAPFKIVTRNRAGEQLKKGGQKFNVTVQGPTIAAEVTVKDNEDGTYDVEYVAKEPGKHHIDVQVETPVTPSEGEKINPDNKERKFLRNPDGPGVDGGEELDDCNDAEFVITAKDYNGDPIKEGGAKFDIKVHDPNGDDLECECVDNNDGTYSCKYAPEFPGDYTVDIKLNGDKVGKAPYEVCVGEGVDNQKSGVDCFQFTILAKSKRGGPVKPGNAKFSVKIIHENGTEIPQENIDIKNLKEAKYRVTYKVSEHGDYTIHCLLNNRDIKGSPWVQQC
ncbi:actin binding protein, putative [Entamoeba dispar SAW760]|uniref:Actin binding protein, putative n=1 Tax=Entamoeba dispar (strain ATCC PRA-260 / SAW760) TaxID=370354 RepID=B0EJU7_ENTDS|nr:actin binding protein, putative [Entamoeba dispar SAW760]EDR25199.1 actin binding protein, putative [Entamoeba dispar SAW760]|eukprot:EDR25199.1 actin binding protein, putative [Entamoeba dispar SAW760]